MNAERYFKEAILGEGTTSRIYRARDVRLDRYVALKVPRDKSSVPRKNMVASLLAEAATMAKLDHPHILPVFDIGDADQDAYVALQLIDRGDLDSVISSQRLSARQIAQIVGQIASAIDFCTSQGIAHRDVKPSNILIDSRERSCLADFGLACQTSSDDYASTAGDVAYMAPEHVPKSIVFGEGSACDQFALGVTAYQLLSGRPPLDPAPEKKYRRLPEWARSCTAFRLMCGEDVRPVSQVTDVSSDVDDVLARMLAVSPDERFDSCIEAATALRKALEAPRRTRIFLSYARADEGIVDPIVTVLETLGLDIWWDKKIPKGVNWDEEIEKSLNESDAMLVVLSQRSLQSDNVRDEWGYWIDEMSDKPIITLVVDDCKVPYRLHRRNHVETRGRDVNEYVEDLFAALLPSVLEIPPSSDIVQRNASLTSLYLLLGKTIGRSDRTYVEYLKSDADSQVRGYIGPQSFSLLAPYLTPKSAPLESDSISTDDQLHEKSEQRSTGGTNG